MGVSTGVRVYHKNLNMQPTGICNKIENYISELKQWSVWRTIILGQFLSIVLYWLTQLNHHINKESLKKLPVPTAQNLPHYVMMCLVYTTWMSCRGAGNGLISVIRSRGWRYLLLALIDVEANTLITSSHQFTSISSIQILDCVAIPVALALSCLVLGVRYRIVHIVGISICLMGVGCLVWAGIDENKDPGVNGKNQLVGDMLCLGGAVLFSVTTVLQELAVKTVDIIEYLGMIGFFGTILSITQVCFLERIQLETVTWNIATPVVITALIFFCVTQFVFFSLVPVILFESGATALQLALLSSDFLNVFIGMLNHRYKFHTLFFLSLALTMTGIFIYAIKKTPMSTSSQRQQLVETPAPDYSDVILRGMSQPTCGEVDVVANLGMSGPTGTLEAIKTMETMENNQVVDSGKLPLSASSDTAFTSFYGSEANM
ncbi:hypothetical protein HCN44_008224 [Aphidius gifuensis]|uniref:Solute carrier family 35 member F2 n=2 Tax=Aphidius gifuensis TaxID=684658 RepID=A0A834XM91_APHGI|nr:hypothetical protein HCN44_008224 [Aphidius gifuensis]